MSGIALFDIDDVAPFTGAWIEIQCWSTERKKTRSLPSRERGLKYIPVALRGLGYDVAPFTGA